MVELPPDPDGTSVSRKLTQHLLDIPSQTDAAVMKRSSSPHPNTATRDDTPFAVRPLNPVCTASMMPPSTSTVQYPPATMRPSANVGQPVSGGLAMANTRAHATPAPPAQQHGYFQVLMDRYDRAVLKNNWLEEECEGLVKKHRLELESQSRRHQAKLEKNTLEFQVNIDGLNSKIAKVEDEKAHELQALHVEYDETLARITTLELEGDAARNTKLLSEASVYSKKLRGEISELIGQLSTIKEERRTFGLKHSRCDALIRERDDKIQNLEEQNHRLRNDADKRQSARKLGWERAPFTNLSRSPQRTRRTTASITERDHPGRTSAKRLICVECYQKDSKCDGHKTCSECKKDNQTCHYRLCPEFAATKHCTQYCCTKIHEEEGYEVLGKRN